MGNGASARYIGGKLPSKYFKEFVSQLNLGCAWNNYLCMCCFRFGIICATYLKNCWYSFSILALHYISLH